MSTALRIQAVLADRPGEKMAGYQVASAAGMTFKAFSRRVPDMVKSNQISRAKLKGASNGFYWYWMTEEQTRLYRLRAALENGGIGFDGAMVTDTDDLHERLKFLRMLKEKTVIGEYGMLGKVIEDYERTLKLRRAAAERVEEDDRLPGRRLALSKRKDERCELQGGKR